jgi:hypothetical protein
LGSWCSIFSFLYSALKNVVFFTMVIVLSDHF